MASGTNLRPAVIAAKDRIDRGRQLMRQRHEAGSHGIQVCARFTELADAVIVDLYHEALRDQFGEQESEARQLIEENVALVAHGGYGRRELAPYSDIDLMLMYHPRVRSQIVTVAERLVRDICDTRLVLGQSVRTPKEAVAFARQDAQILTSLADARHLTGNEEMTRRLRRQLRGFAARRRHSVLLAIDAERRSERRQYGETIYLLEPNVKRSRGGLRDIQLVRWIGFCCYGMTDPDGLYMAGVLDQEERDRLRAATEYLLKIRNELHFHAASVQDRLARAEQVRLAKLYNFKDVAGLQAVEQFMQEYFRYTRAVRYISSRFLTNAYRRSRLRGFFGTLLSHRVANNYRVGPYHIVATRLGLEKLRHDLIEVLRLAELATLYDKRIGHDTWEAVRDAANTASDEITPEAATRFLALLSRPPQLFRILNRLHELEVLEKFIPEFNRARGLLQFNEYHKFTVDEHCLQAVKCATEFAQDDGPLGQAYRSLSNKHLLHLALLLHDVGKGYPEDHSEVGRRIALETADRLGLPEHQKETLALLVHKHLLMTHLALWRDINDQQVVLQLALDIGSPETLQMLYILSAADLASVGPGILNDWKIELLTQLYQRTMQQLSREDPIVSDQEEIARRRRDVASCVSDHAKEKWLLDQIAALPSAYLRGAPADTIASTLMRASDLTPDDAAAWGAAVGEQGVLEFVVCAYETETSGIFHKLTGALTGKGFDILSAQINTLKDGLVIDRFHVVDPEHGSMPETTRISQTAEALVKTLKSADTTQPRFPNTWTANREDASTLSPMPTRVLYDNATSKKATILEIFAPNRIGLLYAITRELFELGLAIKTAKIGTHLDQVVDVFYVTEKNGEKVDSESRLDYIQHQVIRAIERVGSESVIR